MKLKDKVALITGGAQGIGQAIGQLYASAGAHIVVCDVMEELLKKTAAEFEQHSWRNSPRYFTNFRAV